jgi:hypothetical protein
MLSEACGPRLGGDLLDLTMGAVPQECKHVVVGIDFGTTYSGVAYAYKNTPTAIRQGAPSARDPSQTKVPTAVLIDSDGSYKFGHAAVEAYNEYLMAHVAGEQLPGQLYKGFKMELKDKDSGFDTLMAKSAAGTQHPVLDLTVKCLSSLKDHALRGIADGYGGVLPLDDIQWVLTVPAIWNDFGKAFMRKAAFMAGLVSAIESDNLMLVLEPEGAALAVHVGAGQNSLLGVGARFMVLDCGGGTIDITAYDVASVKPLRLDAAIVPAGGAWGGECVDAEFRKFLGEFLGPKLYTAHAKPSEFYQIQQQFEVTKLNFDPSREPTNNVRLADVVESREQLVQLAEAWNAKYPRKKVVISPAMRRNWFLTMSKELMLSFFEPSLSATVAETKRALDAAPGVRFIVVVGGYGASWVLSERVFTEFHQKGGVNVVLCDPNPKPQGAIALGAVYFGLYKNIIRARVASYYYGVEMRINGQDETFELIVCKGERLEADHLVARMGLPINPDLESVRWRVFRSKGGPDDTVPPKLTKGLVCLGTVSAPCPKHADLYERRQFAQFRFGGPEIKVSIRNALGDVTRASIDMV